MFVAEFNGCIKRSPTPPNNSPMHAMENRQLIYVNGPIIDVSDSFDLSNYLFEISNHSVVGSECVNI